MSFCTQVCISLFIICHPFVMFFSDQISAMRFHGHMQGIPTFKPATDVADFQSFWSFIIWRLVGTLSLCDYQSHLMRSDWVWQFWLDFVSVHRWHMRLTFAFTLTNSGLNQFTRIVSLANERVWFPFLKTPFSNNLHFCWREQTVSAVFMIYHI